MIFEKKVVGMYRNILYQRCEDKGKAYYFSSDDFEGLQKEPFSFTASGGHTLQGYFYQYADPRTDRLVVFDHGFGCGHRSYLREIETLCRHGFRVFTYDHTGCVESGGETPNGLAQSLCDLNDCLTALKSAGYCDGVTLSVMGHSWGGFSTMNIAALHPEIKQVVSMSGFVSVETMIRSIFAGPLALYRKAVLALERSSNPKFADCHAVESLKNTAANVLLIYSDNDPVCRKAPHFDTLRSGLADRKNIRLLLVSNKNHNPNYTEDAVKYLAKYNSDLKELDKKKLLQTEAQKAAFRAAYDWKRMTEQDESVWEEIFRTLDA